MSRLTTRNSEGIAVFKQSYDCEKCGESIWRLPDLGNGSPTDALADYELKEELGMILPAPLHGVESFKMPGVGAFYWMPCMVGDDIYCIYHKEVEGRIEPYIAHEKVPSLEWLVTYIDKFGKTIFLTEEEAKQALKQMGE